MPSAAPIATVLASSSSLASSVQTPANPTGLKFSDHKTNTPYNSTPTGLIGKGKLQPFLDPAVIQQAATALYGPPPTASNPNPNYPTTAEIQREAFTASAVGTYVVGPATYSDRSEQIYAYGKAATSDAFLKGKWQVVLDPPANPSATPNPGNVYANQVIGEAVLIPESFLQSGIALILDLQASVAPGSDPTALPTHGTWTYDTNSAVHSPVRLVLHKVRAPGPPNTFPTKPRSRDRKARAR